MQEQVLCLYSALPLPHTRSASLCFPVLLGLLCSAASALAVESTDGPPSGSQPGGQWVQAAAYATLFLTMAPLLTLPLGLFSLLIHLSGAVGLYNIIVLCVKSL